MTVIRWSSRLIFLVAGAVILSACTTVSDYTPLLSAEPAMGAVLNRAPRTLRLYYVSLPDVENSSLSLTGPNGELAMRGFHTMGANDLMIEINDEVVDGDYTVEWTAVVEDDANSYQGVYNFTVDTE